MVANNPILSKQSNIDFKLSHLKNNKDNNETIKIICLEELSFP